MTIEIKDITEFKKTVCAVPWMHIAVEPNGDAIPCCLTSTHNYIAGNLNTQSIEEIWNSNNMKSLRKDMINGIEPKICNKCFDREKVTGDSGRYHHNRRFSQVLDDIPDITEPDGTCTTMELKYWDFRFSNLCNFKCRSCGPRYSSTWVPDATKLNWISGQEKVWNVESVNNTDKFDFLKEQIENVEEIYFAGGEPLMMSEHWKILDMLLERNKTHVKLSYNTNASILTYGGKNVLDYWRQWNPGKIEVWPSIDEIGDRAELIRSGTVWKKVEENLKAMAALDNINVRPGLTIGAWNVFRLPEIITYLNDIGVIKPDKRGRSEYNNNNFFINLLVDPHHYHVRILPDSFKKEVAAKLHSFIAGYNRKYNTDIGVNLTHILHELSTPYDNKAAKRFVEITAQLDQLRGEDTYKVIPEMEYVRKAINE